MEAFYSQVHLHSEFVKDLSKGRGRRRSYQSATKQFLQVIPSLLEACIGRKRCGWHDAIAGALEARDVVLSFNYDTVIDASLRDVSRRKWDPATGYGVAATGAIDVWRNHTGRGPLPKQGIRLLKLHGSLNWRAAGLDLELLADPYEAARPADDLCIVPPLWQKSFQAFPFHEIWLQARSALTSTKALLVIGYSLPPTDVYTQAMLRIDVQQLDFLLIANPDAAARARIRHVLRSAIRPATRVVELDGIEEIGRLLQQSAALERTGARLTTEPFNLRASDIQSIVAAGQLPRALELARSPTARSVKQRQLALELFRLGLSDEALSIVPAMSNRAEILTLVAGVLGEEKAGRVGRKETEALISTAWPLLRYPQHRDLHRLLEAAKIPTPSPPALA